MTASVQSSAATELADIFWLWSIALFATIVAGATFGILEGGILGLIFGGIYAGIFGVPIVLSVVVLSWAFWLLRFAPLVGALAGGITGIISTAVTWDSIFNTDFQTAVVLAAVIGGAVPGLLMTYFWRNEKPQDNVTRENSSPTWQFSLQDLFIRFTVVATLIAAWSIGIAKLLERKQLPTAEVVTTESDL